MGLFVWIINSLIRYYIKISLCFRVRSRVGKKTEAQAFGGNRFKNDATLEGDNIKDDKDIMEDDGMSVKKKDAHSKKDEMSKMTDKSKKVRMYKKDEEYTVLIPDSTTQMNDESVYTTGSMFISLYKTRAPYLKSNSKMKLGDPGSADISSEQS